MPCAKNYLLTVFFLYFVSQSLRVSLIPFRSYLDWSLLLRYTLIKTFLFLLSVRIVQRNEHVYVCVSCILARSSILLLANRPLCAFNHDWRRVQSHPLTFAVPDTNTQTQQSVYYTRTYSIACLELLLNNRNTIPPTTSQQIRVAFIAGLVGIDRTRRSPRKLAPGLSKIYTVFLGSK